MRQPICQHGLSAKPRLRQSHLRWQPGIADRQDCKRILSGKMENGVAVFKGIPFAAPPVGRLRWREPHQATSWDGVRKADENGNSCVQPKGPGLEMRGLGALSEDCLYLNVSIAAIDPAAKQPVIVWIHGGAQTVGAGSLDLYNGSPLAKKGAVAVNSPPLL